MYTRTNTRRAFMSSLVALVLCLTMLMGTTFAWFTDTASVNVNTIQAGTLKIDLINSKGESVKNKEFDKIGFLTPADAQGNTSVYGDNLLWEPGCRYILEPVTLVNNGNLWAKYEVVITGTCSTNEQNANLADVIEVYEVIEGVEVPCGTLAKLLNEGEGTFKTGTIAPKSEQAFGTIVLKMQTTAGNEYQGLSIDGITVAVYAAQASKESDSFGSDYDAGAKTEKPLAPWEGVADNAVEDTDNDNVIVITTAQELADLAASVNAGNTYAGMTVVLGNDIDLEDREWTPIGTSSNPFSGNFDGQGYTISNLYINKEVGNIAASNRQGLFGTIVPSGATYFKNITLHNANVTGGYHVGGIIATSDGSSQSATGNYLVVTNIKLTGKVTVYGWEGVGGVMGSGNMAEISNITVDVEPGSYVTTMPDGRTNSFACVGSVKGGGYLAKADNITSNMDVTAKTAGTGGLFGVIGGQTVKCYVSNLFYSGKVTLTESSIDKYGSFSNYQHNGLLIGAPRFSVIADQATCSSTGTLELHTENTVETSNNMSDAFTWGNDLFGASRDKALTNKSYAKDYTGN